LKGAATGAEPHLKRLQELLENGDEWDVDSKIHIAEAHFHAPRSSSSRSLIPRMSLKPLAEHKKKSLGALTAVVTGVVLAIIKYFLE